MEITKIILKSASGYGPVDEAYEDRLVITSNSIAYEYKPHPESNLETNISRKWSYKTDSPIYTKIFEEICKMTPYYLYNDEILVAHDIGPTIISAVFEDGHRETVNYWCPGEFFSDYFRLIKKMVPSCEYVPPVIMTAEDFETDTDDELVF